MYGFAILNLIHDLWTSNRVVCILGASVSFINMHRVKRYLPLIVQKHTLEHPAKAVVNNINNIYQRIPRCGDYQ